MKKYSASWVLFHLKNNALVDWLYSDKYVTLYLFDKSDTHKESGPYEFGIDRMSDYDFFQPTESWHHIEKYKEFARNTRAAGNSCLTYVEDDILIYSSWGGFDVEKSRFGHAAQTIIFPPHTATSFTAYTHPNARGKGLCTNAVKRLFHLALGERGQNLVIAGVNQNNIPAHKVHMSAGMRKFLVMKTKRVFGITQMNAKLEPGIKDYILEEVTKGSWKITHV